MNGTRLSAVVVTWNSKNDIAACLDSLLAQTTLPAEVSVVDNASTDGTADFIAANYSTVNLIRLDYNAGFAKANNIGIKASTGDWMLLLNPDASLEPNWAEQLLAFAEHDSRIGMLGGILWRSGVGVVERTVIDSVGIEIYKSRRVRDAGAGEGASVVPSESVRVFGVCAAAVLLKRKMLDDILIEEQVFPERFFCYYEDADLAWRAFRRGWQAWTIPTAHGFHRRGGSPIGSRFSRYYTHRNRLWLILRNDSFGSMQKSIPELLAHELLMLARVVRYPYLLGAVWQAVGGIGKSLSERKLLVDKDAPPVPFKQGTGFSSVEKSRAISPKKKIFQ